MINFSIKILASKIASQLDKLDGEDGEINTKTWEDSAIKKLGVKDNVKTNISIFEASKLIANHLEKQAGDITSKIDIGNSWLKALGFESSQDNTQFNKIVIENNTKRYRCTEENDAIRTDTKNIALEIDLKALKTTIDKHKDKHKDTIVTNLYNKWSSKFKQSPLKKEFYSKLYDTIKILNCRVRPEDFNSEQYSSIEEQTMDEVIAIFAGEAKLNPKARNGIYRGLFQLAAPGLKDLKKWAKQHPNLKGMDNINPQININGFGNLSGEKQLDYLVAYIGKAKEYSKIPENETITPAQVWAMIKFPFKGQSNTKITAQKVDAIKNVFKNSDVPHGSIS